MYRLGNPQKELALTVYSVISKILPYRNLKLIFGKLPISYERRRALANFGLGPSSKQVRLFKIALLFCGLKLWGVSAS